MSDHDTLDVWLAGKYAGKLRRGEEGLVEFVYDETYMSSPSSTPLSLSMPLGRIGHGYLTTQAWIENLIPENAKTKDLWARHFGETRTDAFSLLKHMGLDAPGAVQIVREGATPSGQGGFEELSENQIATRLRDIRETRTTWNLDDDDDIRYSLAGQQSKFAVVKSGDTWLEPTGRSASTHIVKPGMQSMKTPRYNDQAAEFLTMRAAQKLGLRVADVDILFFENEPAFVTKRFDRVQVGDQVVRIHQEDLCQALGVAPDSKYETDGGPGVVDVGDIISRHSAAPEKDRAFFARALAFNLMVAGIDGHGKNFSLLLNGGNVRFAPLYDLISAHPVINAGLLGHKGKMGMRYGKEDRIRGINGRNLMRTADALGYDRGELLVAARAIGQSLPDAFAQSLEEMPDIPVTDSIRRLPDTAATFVEDRLETINDQDLETPRYSTRSQLSRFVESRRGEIWVPGRYRNGRWVTGHYRQSPRARS